MRAIDSLERSSYAIVIGALVVSLGASVLSCRPKGPPPMDCEAEFSYDERAFSTSANVARFSVSFEKSTQAIREVDQMVERYASQWGSLCREYNAGVVDKVAFQQRSQDLTEKMDRIQALQLALGSAPDAETYQEVLRQIYATAVPDKAVDLAVELTVLAQRPGDAGFRPLEPGARVPTDSRLRLSIQLSAAAHLYVYQVTPSRGISVLFPDARIPVTNPLSAAAVLELPPSPASFRVNADDLGIEEFHVVASATPISALEANLAQVNQQPGSVSSDMLDCNARGLEYDAGRDCLTDRGIIRTSGNTLSAVNAAADDGVHVVYRFEHTAR